jgi:hypothetical protein
MLYYLQSHWSYTGHGLNLLLSAETRHIKPRPAARPRGGHRDERNYGRVERRRAERQRAGRLRAEGSVVWRRHGMGVALFCVGCERVEC